MLLKKCRKCKVEKDTKFFSRDVSKRSGFNDRCKACRTIEDREYLKKNPFKNRKCELKLRYNLTLKEYENLILEQNNKCSICSKELNGKKEPAVDHDHITGKVRSLLCSTCNMGLGNFKDNTSLLSEAILYLERHTKK